MLRPGPHSLLVITAFALLTAPLLAQRYQERDHTVFHRPAAPPKHQAASTGVTAVNHPSAGVPGTATHATEQGRHHDMTLTPPASVEPRSSQAPK